MTTKSIPRPEYPRPQFRRFDWLNLNGPWSYAFDFSRSGKQKAWEKSNGFDNKINVPFCPESRLSGVQHTDFIENMWYHRKISIPKKWQAQHIILHFGGVDYVCTVYIDGNYAGCHVGGMGSFEFDITQFVKPGKTHDLVVFVEDYIHSNLQPGGKQSQSLESSGCNYTRTTGIWQTVWLEPVPEYGLKRCRVLTDLDTKRITIIPEFYEVKNNNLLRASVYDGKNLIAVSEIPANNGSPSVMALSDIKPWSPEDPFLYDLKIEVVDQKTKQIDEVFSYAGIRKIHIQGNRIYLNNKPIYLRLVLDQGFYPDGIWTAPSDKDLKRDVELSMKAGFNGARLHQKVFEERFHFWADKLGYLTWGESASWGFDLNSDTATGNFLNEWREIVVRDRNHPSIIAWTPFNETYYKQGVKPQHNLVQIDAYNICKELDPSRPVNDTSGYVHAKTDIWTVHQYQQNPNKLKKSLSIQKGRGVFRNNPEHEPEYSGQPYIIDEFGGTKWVPGLGGKHGGKAPDWSKGGSTSAWGYGQAPTSEAEFLHRLEGLVDAVLSRKHICGYCYTQLTDIEQEQNGVYTYNRKAKLDMNKISKIFKKTKVK